MISDETTSVDIEELVCIISGGWSIVTTEQELISCKSAIFVICAVKPVQADHSG